MPTEVHPADLCSRNFHSAKGNSAPVLSPLGPSSLLVGVPRTGAPLADCGDHLDE